MSGSSNIPERREFFAAEGQDVARYYPLAQPLDRRDS